MSTPESRWRHLEEHSRNYEADSNDSCFSDRPKWLDIDRFIQARSVMQKFAIGIEHSSFVGQLFILLLPDILEPLLATGNCRDIPNLYRRFLKTTLHINSWYEQDVFNPTTKAYRTIRHARRMHRNVQGMMTDKFKVPGASGRSVRWLTQYDMALSQFSFIGFAMLHPRRSGLIAATNEELELINYCWRVLGYLMGIKDEFNACHFDKYEDIVAFNSLIWESSFKPAFKRTPCPQGVEMCKALCISLAYFTPHISFNSQAHWWKDEWTFAIGKKLDPMSIHDLMLYSWTFLSFTYLLRYNFMIKLQNLFFGKLFARRLKNKDKEYERLKLKYSNDSNFTFYSGRVDYPVNVLRYLPTKIVQKDCEARSISSYLVIILISLVAMLGYFIAK